MSCKEYPHSASKKLFYYSKFVYMSGEDSLTSSEGSSLMWEYSNDVRLEESELLSSSTISITSIPESPSPMASPRTTPVERSLKHLLSRSDEEVRERYFQKLRRNGMLPEKPRKKSHHGKSKTIQLSFSIGMTHSSRHPTCPHCWRETGRGLGTGKNKKWLTSIK